MRLACCCLDVWNVRPRAVGNRAVRPLPVLEAGLVPDDVLCPLQHDKDSKAWAKLQSLVMQLRKCCNHPYLFPDAEPSFDGLTTGAALSCCPHLRPTCNPDSSTLLSHARTHASPQARPCLCSGCQVMGIYSVQFAAVINQMAPLTLHPT